MTRRSATDRSGTAWAKTTWAVAIGLPLALAIPATPAWPDPVRDNEWHLSFLDMDRVHQVSQGEGVTVAVIDAGINGNHPDLVGNVLPGVSVLPGHPGNGWEDVYFHGTAMAGLIAGHGHNGGRDGILGIAPKAKIFPVQVMSGDHDSSDVLGNGINAALQHGARVISVSIGNADSGLLREAVERAQQADVVIVAGVGNKPQDLGPVTWPARYDGVVAVAATDRQGNHPDFSVTGPQVLVSAPGADIELIDTGNRYGKSSGTSASTAITAGVVALIRAKYPTMKATEVIHRLTATATDRGPKGRDPEYGYGIVNPYAALTADVPPIDPSGSPSPTSSGIAQNSPPQRGTPTGLIIVIALVAAGVLATALAALIVNRRRAAA
ncbi:MAG: hypothetical protein AUI14_12735 [Actinobacteria bacterium 13_2_20CM_2_71_6]|nr:MAG: hypothetical protein AUI14_12735 [Actinobacteria bacterium 13_2_20CM_2_71_6]